MDLDNSGKTATSTVVNLDANNKNSGNEEQITSSNNRVVTPGLIARSIGVFQYLGNGAFGLGELLFHDIGEAGTFLLMSIVPHHIQVRFIEQWQTLSISIDAPPEYQDLAIRRRSRMKGIVRLLGSLLPLSPVERPYIRLVNMGGLSRSSSSTESLYTPSLQSFRKHKRVKELQSTALKSSTPASQESGFGTFSSTDSDEYSESSNGLVRSRAGSNLSEEEVRSVRSLTYSLASRSRGKRNSKRRRNHRKLRPSSNMPMNSTENGSLESHIPFTDPEALVKIRDLESQLEFIKGQINEMITAKVTAEIPSTPTSGCPPPPPPPPPSTPLLPPPPPPPMPSKLLCPGLNNNGSGKSLQQMLESKQGNLSKTTQSDKPKVETDTWSSVINAIKGGKPKLRKVNQHPHPLRKPLPASPGDAYRKALQATLKQRFMGVHGSDKESDSDAEPLKSDGQWDTDEGASPLVPQLKSYQVISHRQRLMPPKKLHFNPITPPATPTPPTPPKDSPPTSPNVNLLNIMKSESLVLSSQSSGVCSPVIEEEPTQCDSNEQFRKFLQADRRKSLSKPPSALHRSTSVPIPDSPLLVRSRSIHTIEEKHEPSNSPLKNNKLLANKFIKQDLTNSSSPFGQHLLKRTTSLQSNGSPNNATEDKHTKPIGGESTCINKSPKLTKYEESSISSTSGENSPSSEASQISTESNSLKSSPENSLKVPQDYQSSPKSSLQN